MGICVVRSFSANFAKLCGKPGFLENVLHSFSCFYIEIAYSNFTFCVTYMLSFRRAAHFQQNKHTHLRYFFNLYHFTMTLHRTSTAHLYKPGNPGFPFELMNLMKSFKYIVSNWPSGNITNTYLWLQVFHLSCLFSWACIFPLYYFTSGNLQLPVLHFITPTPPRQIHRMQWIQQNLKTGDLGCLQYLHSLLRITSSQSFTYSTQ